MLNRNKVSEGCIRTWTSLNFGQVLDPDLELLDLEVGLFKLRPDLGLDLGLV